MSTWQQMRSESITDRTRCDYFCDGLREESTVDTTHTGNRCHHSDCTPNDEDD